MPSFSITILVKTLKYKEQVTLAYNQVLYRAFCHISNLIYYVKVKVIYIIATMNDTGDLNIIHEAIL